MTETYYLGVWREGYAKRMNGEDGPYEVWVETFNVCASNAKGQRFFLADFQTEDEIEAESMVLALADSTPETNPNDWVEGEPCYGSEAWGPENDYELACFEADCYGEPRPQWF